MNLDADASAALTNGIAAVAAGKPTAVAVVPAAGPLSAATAALAAQNSNQQNDSTDEDSGIESIMRVVREPNRV